FAKVTTCIVIEAAARSRAGVRRLRSLSPRRILTGPFCGSANETTSATSALSAAGFCRFLSRVGELPRTILTAPQPVSGKVTSCTLPVLPSIACWTASAEICGLDFEPPSAANPGNSVVAAPQKMLAKTRPRIVPLDRCDDLRHPQLIIIADLARDSMRIC